MGQRKSKMAQAGGGAPLIVPPTKHPAGRRVIAAHVQSERWTERFLKALKSLTPLANGVIPPNLPSTPSISGAKRAPTTSRASTPASAAAWPACAKKTHCGSKSHRNLAASILSQLERERGAVPAPNAPRPRNDATTLSATTSTTSLIGSPPGSAGEAVGV